MSRNRHKRHRTDDVESMLPNPLIPKWEQLALDFDRLSPKAFKARLHRLSRVDQQQCWKRISETEPGQTTHALEQVDNIERAFTQVEKIVPCAAWLNDFKGNPVDAGGEFPPGGRSVDFRSPESRSGKVMVRAAGERRVYPPQTVGSRGLNYEVELQILYTGSSQSLSTKNGKHKVIRKRDFDPAQRPDGYLGSVVHITDLPRSERHRYRKNKNGKHGISNTMHVEHITD